MRIKKHFQNSWWRGAEKEMNCPQSTNNDAKNCEVEEDSQNSSKKQWCELSEVVDSDFSHLSRGYLPKQKS